MTVTHTRPVGGPNYAAVRAAGISPQLRNERVPLLDRYGIHFDNTRVPSAVIDREGCLLIGGHPDQARTASLWQRLRSDWRDFLAFYGNGWMFLRDAAGVETTRPCEVGILGEPTDKGPTSD